MAKVELKENYITKIMPEMKKKFGYENDMAVPTLEKIKVNVGLGEALANKKSLEQMVEVLSQVTGQRPVITKAKVAISNFKIKIGDEIGVTVTLRGDRMWYFLEKLINIVLPRVRDFRGVSPKSFDGRGNYSLGIKEHTVFPEIDPNKVDKIRGLGISIVTTANTDEEGRELLKLMGMPFTKSKKEAEVIENS